MKRECGECTRCCEGWLSYTVNGYKLSHGRKCPFASNNQCSIYTYRPQDPCRDFNCEWIKNTDNSIPDWLHPLLSKVIIEEKRWGENKDKFFWLLVECGQPMDSSTLAWFVKYSMQKNIPMIYADNNARIIRLIGPAEFQKAMTPLPEHVITKYDNKK